MPVATDVLSVGPLSLIDTSFVGRRQRSGCHGKVLAGGCLCWVSYIMPGETLLSGEFTVKYIDDDDSSVLSLEARAERVFRRARFRRALPIDRCFPRKLSTPRRTHFWLGRDCSVRRHQGKKAQQETVGFCRRNEGRLAKHGKCGTKEGVGSIAQFSIAQQAVRLILLAKKCHHKALRLTCL